MGSFSVFHWIIAIVVLGLAVGILVLPILLLVRMFRGAPLSFCVMCGHEGRGTYRTKGSILIEIVLWLLFIIPGVIYSIWRVTTRAPVCRACGSDRLVPPDSPVARKMRTELLAAAK